MLAQRGHASDDQDRRRGDRRLTNARGELVERTLQRRLTRQRAVDDDDGRLRLGMAMLPQLVDDGEQLAASGITDDRALEFRKRRPIYLRSRFTLVFVPAD